MALDTDGDRCTDQPPQGLRADVLGIRGPARVPMLLVVELSRGRVRPTRLARRADTRGVDGGAL